MQTLIEMHHLILDWFSREGRVFPWRYDSPDPYHVLISEYMLQQTQTSRIAERFPIFLAKFPNVLSLSNASNQEMILAWQGLGYNNRALRLRDCAKAIVNVHEGKIPGEYHALLNLPGIGPYTASAIMSFAYGCDISVIDVNIRRIYVRLNGYSNPEEMSNKSIESFAEQIYPKGKSSEWHQALMDIGAQFCRANQTRCELCPLQEHCSSAFNVRIEKKKVRRSEPSHRDIPNRMWRGRIIEFLRNANQYRSDKSELLHGILGESIDEKDRTWFEDRILPALIKDHLIHYDSQTNIISISQ
jgi:A/G-specific adenine glycosylase